VLENVDAGIAPRARGRTTNHTIRGALATLAAEKQAAPKNVDAGQLAIEDGEPPQKQIRRAAKQLTL
jgi:hypothetical protein